MTSTRDDKDEALLVEALKSREYSDPGPARLEFERRRFLGRVTQEESRPARLVWRTVFVGGFAGAAAVAAAVLLLVFAFPGAIEETEPEVSLSGVWHLETGDAIAVGTPVRVPDIGRASLVLPDGTTLWAGPGTRMIVEDSDGSRIRVEHGHLLARVEPRSMGSRFEVVTPDAEVQVHGTVFSVQVHKERTSVRLHEGAVRLVCGEKSVAMEAGHRVVASNGAILSMDGFGEQEAAVDLELGGGASAVLAALGAVVDATPASEAAVLGEPAEPTIIVADVEDDLLEETLAEEASASAAKTGSAKRPSLRQRVEEAFAAARYADVIDLTLSSPDSTLRFYRARALARVGRWAEAGDTYAAVASEDHGRRAESLYRASSAFKRARLYPRALDMANQAISQGGPNADHAWGVKLSALTGLKQYQAATSHAGVYLDLFPGGAHVGEAYFVQGTGLRLSKKWSAAARAYGSFLSRGTGPAAMRDDASFYHGYCLLKAGNADAGRNALEDYQVQFPRGRHVVQVQTALAL
ncbi:MAG: FecR domain-containing protein [Deltaproteobacteria bacterium]|nr:FecR domain-containing protein [Deltaproteobacteria bacterium]